MLHPLLRSLSPKAELDHISYSLVCHGGQLQRAIHRHGHLHLPRCFSTERPIAPAELQNTALVVKYWFTKPIKQKDGENGGDDFSRKTGGWLEPSSVSDFQQAGGQVIKALLKRDPNKLLKAFAMAARLEGYLQRLPRTTFIEILRSINPEELITPFMRLDIDGVRFGGRFPPTASVLRRLCTEYTHSIQMILRTWRSIGRRTGLPEYKLLLNFARITQDGDAARDIFSLMAKYKVEPDMTCYNHYFEAVCWNSNYEVEQPNLRIIPYTIRNRQAKVQNFHSSVAFKTYLIGDAGLKQEVVKMFDRMVKSGVSCNTATFSMLILAMAREGDLSGVKSIIQSVWNVDVDVVLQGDETAQLLENTISPLSHIYPDSSVLLVLAHVFAANNDIPAAIRMVDFFARKFHIDIDLKTWEELLSWTCIHAEKRSASDILAGKAMGQLPRSSVESLWDTMVSAPYNIKPTVPLHYYFLRYCFGSDERLYFPFVLEKLQAMQEAAAHTLMKLHEEEQKYDNRSSRKKVQYPARVRSKEEQKYEELKFEVRRDHLMLYSLVHLALGTRHVRPLESWCLSWGRIGAPRLIQQLWDYRDMDGLRYDILTGHVQIHTPTALPETRRHMVVLCRKIRAPGLKLYQPDSAIPLPNPHATLTTNQLGVHPRYGTITKPQWFQRWQYSHTHKSVYGNFPRTTKTELWRMLDAGEELEPLPVPEGPNPDLPPPFDWKEFLA
jgi:hypothetical protein